MKWILYSAAILAFVSFWVAGFARDGTNLYIGASVLLLLSSVTCWIGSIYIWSVSNQNKRGHILTLAALVLLGFIFGWLYVLIRAHKVRHVAGPSLRGEQV